MNDQNKATAISRGVDAHRAGRLEEASAHYKEALDNAPDDAEAQSLYGVSLVYLGRPHEGEQYLRTAVEKEPQEHGFKINLAAFFQATGDYDAALRELDAVIARDPKRAGVWEMKGDAHLQRNELEPAAQAFDQSLQLFSDNHPLTLKLARTLWGLQQFHAATATVDHADKILPDSLEARELRWDILIALGDWKTLLVLTSQWTRSNPEDPAAWRYLSTGYYEIGHFLDSRIAFEKSMGLGERTPDNLARYAKLSMKSLEFDRAEKALDEAEALSPDEPGLLSAKALLLTYQGRTKEAEDYCLRCLAVNPKHLDAYAPLSTVRKGALTESEEAPLIEISRQEDIMLESRATASFTLAHSYDARKEYEKAFAEYQYANGLSAGRNARENSLFNLQGLRAWTSMLIERFNGSPNPHAGEENLPTTPIFIVGLPRSGSTLVESVLAAHSKVAAGGEQPMLPPICIGWVKQQGAGGDGVLSASDREKFIETYFKDATPANGAAYLTDKNMLNIESVGLIVQMFPTAKIINIRRNPLECCLSIFRHNLPKFWNYSNNLFDIGARYGEYARLTAHFERTYPDQFTTIQYEEFTADIDKGARRLIAACGLEWEDACATFQSAEHIAATISAVQVREEVEPSAGRADAYAPYLDVLRDTLAIAKVDLQTGALLGENSPP